MSTPLPGSYPLRGRNNALLTVSLFLEPSQGVASIALDVDPVFCLTSAKDGYIYVRDTFISERDPTGVRWANKYLEGPHHYKLLLKSTWFREEMEDILLELEDILQSEALEAIRTISKSSSPASFQAAKYLASKGWKAGSSRGRPSKAEVQGELKREVERTTRERDDFSRVSKFKVV